MKNNKLSEGKRKLQRNNPLDDRLETPFKPNKNSPFERALTLNSTLTRGKLSKTLVTDLGISPEAVRDFDKYGMTYSLVKAIQHNALLRRADPSSSNYKKQPSDEEFSCEREQEFKPDGSSGTPEHSLPTSFNATEYAPRIFSYLRSRHNISEEDFVGSLTETNDMIRFKTNSKSGAYFFYSVDGQFVIKTMTLKEKNRVVGLLPHYYSHVYKNIQSLLVPLCGIYHVKASHLGSNGNKYFIVMKNIVARSLRSPVHYLYDIKGSKAGRRAKPGETVGKDLDLAESEQKLELGRLRPVFLKQLHRDLQFLCQHNLMDYSLLIGIHDQKMIGRRTLNLRDGEFVDNPTPPAAPEQLQGLKWLDRSARDTEALLEHVEPDTGFEELHPDHINQLSVLRSSPPGALGGYTEGNQVYYVGFIDLFQSYGNWKKMEGTLKGMMKKKEILSARPPAQYATRLFQLMEDVVEGERLGSTLPEFNSSNTRSFRFTSFRQSFLIRNSLGRRSSGSRSRNRNTLENLFDDA